MVRFGGIFDFEEKRERLQEVELELADGEVWNDPDRAQQLGKERASLEQIVGVLSTLGDSLSDLGELAEMASEENDQTALDDVSAELQSLESQLASLEFRRMFRGNWTVPTVIWRFRPGPAVLKPKTGPRCCFECICAGRNVAASVWR